MNDITVKDIAYRVKEKLILEDINFIVKKGEAFALLGENGAGKSTLIDIILRDLTPTSGQISFFEKSSPDFSRMGVVYDQLPLFKTLRVYELIDYFSTIHKISYKQVKENYFEDFEIKKIGHSFIKELSQGEKKRVAILLALIHHPELLILDEPFANLDPTLIDRFWKLMIENNRTILFSTHNWKDAEKIADKVAFLYQGRLLSQPQKVEAIFASLPARKKIQLSFEKKLLATFSSYSYYIYDGSINIFFPENSNLLNAISKITGNFSIQDADLRDAYLFAIHKNNYNDKNTF